LLLFVQQLCGQVIDSIFQYSEVDIATIIKERAEHRQQMIDEFENFSAPRFEGVDLAGEHHFLTDYEGHILILFFWNTFCQKCLDDLPVYNQIRKEYPQDLVTIISFVDEPKNEVQAYVDRYYPDHKLSFPIIPNAKKFAKEHFGGMDHYTPRIFIVDKYQVVRKVLTPDIAGDRKWDAYQLIQPVVEDLLKE